MGKSVQVIMGYLHLFEIVWISSFEKGAICSCFDTAYCISFYLEWFGVMYANFKDFKIL